MVEEVTEQVKDQSYLRQTHLKLKAIKHKYNLEKFMWYNIVLYGGGILWLKYYFDKIKQIHFTI